MTITLIACSVTLNQGGGVHFDVLKGQLTLTQSSIRLNTNTGYPGGGVRVVSGSMGATGCSFSQNVATVASGGGVSFESATGTLSLTDCLFDTYT